MVANMTDTVSNPRFAPVLCSPVATTAVGLLIIYPLAVPD
jgi:hypothetical protein